MCKFAYRSNVFSKARKQTKRLSGVVCIVIRSADLGGRRQRRIQRRRLIGRITEWIVSSPSNAKAHQRCAADCIRYALHRRTARARTRHWGRRRGRKMCVDMEMANGCEYESIHLQKSLEFAWNRYCVIVFVYCCVLFCCYGLMFRRITMK